MKPRMKGRVDFTLKESRRRNYEVKTRITKQYVRVTELRKEVLRRLICRQSHYVTTYSEKVTNLQGTLVPIINKNEPRYKNHNTLVVHKLVHY